MTFIEYRKLILDKVDESSQMLAKSNDINSVLLGLMTMCYDLTQEEFAFYCYSELYWDWGWKEKKYLIESLAHDYPGVLVLCNRSNYFDKFIDIKLIDFILSLMNHENIKPTVLANKMFWVVLEERYILKREEFMLFIQNAALTWKDFMNYNEIINIPKDLISEDWIEVMTRLTGRIYNTQVYYKYLLNAIIDLNTANLNTLNSFVNCIDTEYRLDPKSWIPTALNELKYSSYSRKNIRKFKKMLEDNKIKESVRREDRIYPPNHTGKYQKKLWYEKAITQKPWRLLSNDERRERNKIRTSGHDCSHFYKMYVTHTS